MLHFKATKRKPYIWVWRVEDENGEGPYRNGNGDLWDYEDGHHTSYNGHPLPSEEFPAKDLKRIHYYDSNHNFKFGFVSIRQYHKWFNKAERNRQAQVGIKLRRKRAEMVVRSSSQCMYVPYQPPIPKMRLKPI